MALTKPTPNDAASLKRVVAAIEQQSQKFEAYLVRDKDKFVRIIEVAAAKNPTINENVFRAYIDEVNRVQPHMAKEIRVAFESTLNPTLRNLEINKIRTKYGEEVRDNIFKEYGRGDDDAGKQAMLAVAREAQPQSMFAGPVKAIFNSENGGPQWGGIIGGLGAAVGGYFLTQGAGSFLNILGTLAVTAIGAYVGHSLIDPKSKPLDVPDLHTPKGPAVTALGKQKQKGDTLNQDVDFGTILANQNATPSPSTIRDAKELGVKGNLAQPAQGMTLDS